MLLDVRDMVLRYGVGDSHIRGGHSSVSEILKGSERLGPDPIDERHTAWLGDNEEVSKAWRDKSVSTSMGCTVWRISVHTKGVKSNMEYYRTN